jgi:hypothetical protein
MTFMMKSRVDKIQECFLSFSPKLKIKIYKTVILPVVLDGCETLSLNSGGGTLAKSF